jgi:hypothetical protein
MMVTYSHCVVYCLTLPSVPILNRLNLIPVQLPLNYLNIILPFIDNNDFLIYYLNDGNLFVPCCLMSFSE